MPDTAPHAGVPAPAFGKKNDELVWFLYSSVSSLPFLLRMPPILRILIIIALIVYIAWRVKRSWGNARDVVEANDDAMKAWKMQFQAFRQDPRFQKLKAHLDQTYPNTLDVPADPETYQVVYVTVFDEKGQSYLFDEIEQGKFLTAYLKNAKKQLQVSLDLANGTFHENALGAVAFRTVVPYWAGK